MKHKKIYRKLVLSASAAAMTAICLTSTTFAWFTRNDNVWLESTNVKMQWDDGILISLDGENFSQDISANDFKKLVAGTAENYDNIRFDGSTVKLDSDGKIVYDDDGNVEFEYDNVKSEDDGLTYEHETNKASKNAEANSRYIQFDLYFRISFEGSESSPNFVPVYNLVFGNNTAITASDTSVILTNDLTAYQNGEVKNLKAKDELELNVANAMRLGVNSTDLGGLKIYETTTDKDLGGVAYEGAEETDYRHNKNYNAMYTYYNSLFRRYPLESAKANMVETDSTLTDDSLGVFTYDKTKKEYNDLKVTFYLWLEGWDADYIYGVDAEGRDVNIFLDFTYKDARL